MGAARGAEPHPWAARSSASTVTSGLGFHAAAYRATIATCSVPALDRLEQLVLELLETRAALARHLVPGGSWNLRLFPLHDNVTVLVRASRRLHRIEPPATVKSRLWSCTLASLTRSGGILGCSTMASRRDRAPPPRRASVRVA